jgi:uncharacterized membrane protein YdbT with pleckstrin-like domain
MTNQEIQDQADMDALMEYVDAYREEHGFLARWSVIILIIPIVIILVFIWVIAKIIKKVLGRR